MRLSLMSEKATLREWDRYVLSWGWLWVLLVERDFSSSSESFRVFGFWNEGEATSSTFKYSNNLCQQSNLSCREYSNEKQIIGNFEG